MLKTVMGRGSAEQIIEKSKFIAYVAPATNREEAEAFIAEIREMHKDATHNVPAMVIGENMQIQWGSDDGEPGGTSGTPMVQMITKEGITNVVVVVTRYFGGIKLGPGGLVRAYTGSCKLGLLAAGLCEMRERVRFTVSMGYSYLAKLQNMAKTQEAAAGGFDIKDIIYADNVTLTLEVEVNRLETVKTVINNLTGGMAEILSEERNMVKVPIK